MMTRQTASKYAGRLRGHKGFTLVEVMIVVCIIGILLSIALPNFMTSRNRSKANTCRENLRFLSWAKEQWAMAYNKGGSATPTQSDLAPEFIKKYPTCPSGGTYTLGSVDQYPTCSIGGDHSYP